MRTNSKLYYTHLQGWGGDSIPSFLLWSLFHHFENNKNGNNRVFFEKFKFGIGRPGKLRLCQESRNVYIKNKVDLLR